ncbi:MAG TPA: hypothetical protein VF099_19135, partial [Ktedonobacterales bacterium]
KRQPSDTIARMKRLFDVYLAVDWSARSKPGPAAPAQDALWVGEAFAPGLAEAEAPRESYWRTRRACRDYLRARLLEHIQAGRRVFIGCDFPYGYPSGLAQALSLSESVPPWRRIWNELSRLIADDASNANNRFEVANALNARCAGPTPGPFWGCPAGTAFGNLLPTSPRYPYQTRAGPALERLRQTERLARGTQPGWKLYGTGSAGGQALLGIPVVCRLRDDPALAGVSRVWPFETGFTTLPTPKDGPTIIHAEIWPGLVSDQLDRALPIRDQAQVRAAARWLARLDDAGQLGTLFNPPAAHSSGMSDRYSEEEGWILGVR